MMNKSAQALKDFDKAAQNWGYASAAPEQHPGGTAEIEAEYKRAYAALLDRLLILEARLVGDM